MCAVFAGKEASMSEECRLQRQIASNLGVPIVTDIPRKEYTVVIDAVFGVGLSRTIAGRYKDVIKEMNQIHAEKVAVDVPSGISSFDGECAGNGISCGLDCVVCMRETGNCFVPGIRIRGRGNPCGNRDRDQNFSETAG